MPYVPLGEQVLSFIASMTALVIGGLVVTDVMISGLAMGMAHFTIGMSAFGVARWAIGRAIRTRPVPVPVADDDSNDDD